MRLRSSDADGGGGRVYDGMIRDGDGDIAPLLLPPTLIDGPGWVNKRVKLA